MRMSSLFDQALGWVVNPPAAASRHSVPKRFASRIACSNTENHSASRWASGCGIAVRSVNRPRPMVSTTGSSGPTMSTVVASASLSGPPSHCCSHGKMLLTAP